ncbi:MAG: hypothetical protein HY909_06705 [Deltaproteobacteria bacterium]|nr:hypothetical protein [Deltaproteobacteria bacterium]
MLLRAQSRLGFLALSLAVWGVACSSGDGGMGDAAGTDSTVAPDTGTQGVDSQGGGDAVTPDVAPTDTSPPGDTQTAPDTLPGDGASMDTAAPDGGAPDGGAPDGTPMDAPSADSGAADASPTDAPAIDATPPDSGARDAPGEDLPAPDAPARDTTPVDAGPSRGAPTVRITAPSPGAVITGMLRLTFAYTAPDDAVDVGVVLDGRELSRAGEPVRVLTFDTGAWPDGPHRLGVTVYDRRGASASDSVAVTFSNPPFRFVSVTTDRFHYANGDTVTLDVRMTAPGATLSADFSSLDSGWDASRVRVTDEGGGRLTLRYAISPTNTRGDRVYDIPLTARDGATPPRATTVPARVRLENLRPFPFAFTAGSFAEGSAAPLPENPSGPALTAVPGPATLSPGATARLSVAWRARAGVPVRALQVRAEGASGHWTVPIADPGASTAELTVALPEDIDPPLPASTWRLFLRVVDAAYAASAEREVALRVEPLGRGGPTMARVRGTVSYQYSVVGPASPCGTVPPTTQVSALYASAVIRALRARDNFELARGAINAASGRFQLAMPVSSEEALLEVRAEVNPGTALAMTVKNNASVTHVFTSRRFTPTPGTGTLDFTVALPTSGAFHILRVLSQTRSTTISATGGLLPALDVFWQSGADSSTCGPRSCSNRAVAPGIANLGIRGGGTVPAGEWDDPVLRHEFGHFVMANLSMTTSPGGSHNPWTQVDPQLAWSEGVATFWGAYTGSGQCYYSSTGAGWGLDVDEANPPLVLLNTATPNTQTSLVSEGVISGALWRVTPPLPPPSALPGPPRPPDPRVQAMLWSIFTYLPARAPGHDGGFAGVDFVDFLEGWLCADPCEEAELRRHAVGTFRFHHVPPDDRRHCTGAHAEPADPAMATRCASPGVLLLTPTGLSRYTLSIDAATRQPFAGGTELPVGLAGPTASQLLRPKRPMALLRPEAGGPTRAAVLNFEERSLSIASLVSRDGAVEREVDLDQNPMTRDPMTAPMGINRIVLSDLPRALSVTPEGHFAFVALENDLLAVVDLDDHRQCATFPVRNAGMTPAVLEDVLVSPDGQTVYVSLSGNRGRAVAELSVPCMVDRCEPIAPPPASPPTLCTVTPRMITNFPAGSPAAGPSPGPLALSPDGSLLAVANFRANNVSVFNTTSRLEHIRPVDSGDEPTVLLWRGTRLFVGKNIAPASPRYPSGSGTVLRIATPSFSPGLDVGLYGGAYSMLVQGANLFVGDRRGGITAVPLTYLEGARGGCVGTGAVCPRVMSTLAGFVRAMVALP